MDYTFDFSLLANTFPVPKKAMEQIKFAKGDHVKVLLYILNDISSFPEAEAVASAVGVSEYEVKEAFAFWENAGIFKALEKESAGTETKQTVSLHTEKPSREDVARRGKEDPKIAYLLRETQLKLGRNLKTNETTSLVWLYDDQGLDVSLLLLIIQYAVTNGRANIRFIESTAVSWIEKGISTLTEADEELRRMALSEQSWSVVCRCFGLDKRKPSAKETELSLLWLEEWKLSPEILTAAYEECVNQKSKFSMSYVAKILENWHKNGDKPTKNKEQEKNNFATHDLDLFEKMLNSKD